MQYVSYIGAPVKCFLPVGHDCLTWVNARRAGNFAHCGASNRMLVIKCIQRVPRPRSVPHRTKSGKRTTVRGWLVFFRRPNPGRKFDGILARPLRNQHAKTCDCAGCPSWGLIRVNLCLRNAAFPFEITRGNKSFSVEPWKMLSDWSRLEFALYWRNNRWSWRLRTRRAARN